MEDDHKKKEIKRIISQIAADTLKELTVLDLEDQQDHQPSSRRSTREAHPRAVLSTKHKPDDPAPLRGNEAASSNGSPTSLPQVIKSNGCKVSR